MLFLLGVCLIFVFSDLKLLIGYGLNCHHWSHGTFLFRVDPSSNTAAALAKKGVTVENGLRFKVCVCFGAALRRGEGCKKKKM